MASFNQVVLLGNVTRDTELRHTPQGTAVIDITLAVNEKAKVGGELKEAVLFIDVTMWGRLAEIAGEYLGRGSQVLISGRLKQESWEQDGQKRTKVKVIATEMKMLSPRAASQSRQEAAKESLAESEIPF